MPYFDLLKEHSSDKDFDGLISTSPHWIIAVIRYAQPLTYSRKKLAKASKNPLVDDINFNPDNSILSQTKPLLIITDDCVSLSIGSTKGNHISTMQSVLIHGDINYVAELLPGDWVFAWAMNSQDTYNKVLDKLQNLKNEDTQGANGFEDGLKFMGRVQDCRKVLAQSPAGLRTVQFNLSAVGFSEFDSQLYFDPQLARNVPSIGQYLMRLGSQINNLMTDSAEEIKKGNGGIEAQKILPELVRIFLGDGAPKELVGSSKLQLADGSIGSEEAPYAYGAPEDAGRILGVTRKTRNTGMYAYSDLLVLVTGVQKYGERKSNDYSTFIPDTIWLTDSAILDSESGLTSIGQDRAGSVAYYTTGYPLKGRFMPAGVEFNNKPVWSLLNEFLNPAINEMYTALKVAPNGRVMPTLVARQLPFSSPILEKELKNDVTSYLENPRWVADASLIRAIDIGRSGSLRFNYVKVFGISPGSGGLNPVVQTVLNPPYRDEMDIKRHGFRPHQATVNCSIQDTLHGPSEWMTIAVDFLMGQHLTLTGTASLVGVTYPIAPGDSFEFDDTVFHIDSVQHSCAISNGVKSFTTQLTLTMGMRKDPEQPKTKRIEAKKKPGTNTKLPNAINQFKNIKNDKDRAEAAKSIGGEEAISQAILDDSLNTESVEVFGDYQQNPDLYLYSGIIKTDNTSYDPGLTVEKQEDKKKTDQ